MKSVINKIVYDWLSCFYPIGCSKVGQEWIFHAWQSHAWPMLPIQA